MSLNIDPNSWAKLNRLLDRALDLPPLERERWIESLDAEHRPLQTHLRELLARAAQVETGEFLQTLPKIGGLVGFEVRNKQDDIVGPYRLMRQLGSGGMGSVWLAERIDGILHRHVALKLPHIAGVRAGLAERMAREREILAQLSHPNIATLYDAGVSEGQPYLALEYVEGSPIDEYCRQRQLGIKARLKLFAQVANAVAFAHAKLIVHRDLKPSNILVTDEGQVRLLDFGIAKLLDDGLDDSTQLTEFAGHALTLDYASPEQIASAPIAIASDIYSLGVILYELLTGERPYRLKRVTRGALEEAILTLDPRRPSEVAAKSDAKILRGDLDTIVLKALKKKPEDRYATANALVEDIFRYLDRKPVLAQPDGEWYRMRKFIARHALAAGLTGAVALAVVLGAALATWQMWEAHRQRDTALLHQRRAEAFSQFMGVLLHDAGAGGQVLTPTALVDRGVAMLERRRTLDDSVAAFMWYELSRSYKFFYQTQRERALLERAAAAARRIGDVNLLAASECAASWSLLESNRAEAERRLEAALQALRGSAVQADFATLECLRAESRLLHAQGRVGEAIALIERGMTRLGNKLRGTWYYAAVRDQLAGLHRAAGDNVAALEISEDQLDMLYEMGRQGSSVELLMLSGYGRDLCRVGEYVACADVQHKVLAALDKSDAAGFALPGGRTRAGLAELALGDAQQALDLAERDLQISNASGNLAVIAQAHWLAASSLLALGRIDAAENRLGAAEEIWRNSPGTFGAYLHEAALLRADIALARGDISVAQRGIDALLSQVDYPNTLSAPRLDAYLQLAARVALRDGRAEAAAAFALDAVQVTRRSARTAVSSGDVGVSLLLHAQALSALGRKADAAAAAESALASLTVGFGESHETTRRAQTLLASL